MMIQSQKGKILLNTIGIFTYLFALWFISIILVRLDSFEAAGVFSLAMTISNVFVSISNYGMKGFQISDVDAKYSDRHYVTSRLLTVILGFVGCTAFSLFSGYVGHTLLVLVAFMTYRSLEAYSDVFHGILQKYDRLDGVGISLSLKGILSLVAFLVSTLIVNNLAIAVGLMCLVAAGIFVFYDIAVSAKYTDVRLDLSPDGRRKTILLLRDSFLMMLFTLTSPLLLSIPRIYFERAYSTEKFGVFASIAAPTIVITTLVTAILLPFIPLFARYYNVGDRRNLLRVSLMSALSASAFGLVCYVGSYFFGALALKILFGTEILRYARVLDAVVVVTSLSSVIMCFYTVFIAARKLLLLFVSSLLPCLICYFIAPGLIDEREMYGITDSMIISQIAQILAMTGIVAWILAKMPRQRVNPPAP